MKKDGFTLIELLVTMIVLAIVTAITIPVFATWLPDYRLRAAARDLYSNFQLAKMAAMRNNSNCAIAFTVNDYTVFLDSDNDLEYDAGEEIITQVLWADYKDVSLDTAQGGGDGLNFMNNDDGLPSIAFRSNGLPRDNAGALLGGTAFLVNTKGMTRSVVISPGGNIAIQ
ncbi:MAG: GspH/FimT family pseudopilin [Deltaproteobacteria bacterium]|nr:GspH/FimT family pseudopilin [Deltaproteobacteria bacterium]